MLVLYACLARIFLDLGPPEINQVATGLKSGTWGR